MLELELQGEKHGSSSMLAGASCGRYRYRRRYTQPMGSNFRSLNQDILGDPWARPAGYFTLLVVDISR
jgi:hypothetical protein